MPKSKSEGMLFFAILAGILLVSSCSASQYSPSKNVDAFAFVNNIEKAREDIENAGGTVTLIFRNDNALAGKFPAKIKSDYIDKVYTEDSLVSESSNSAYLSWKSVMDYKKTPISDRLKDYKDIEAPQNDYRIREGAKESTPVSQIIQDALPQGANLDDTSLYMMGDVSVSVIFIESDESVCIDIIPNTPTSYTCANYGSDDEDWNQSRKQNVMDKITNGLYWWASINPNASLTFFINNETAPSELEPINWYSGYDTYWINDAMEYFGYGPIENPIYPLVDKYINDQRASKGTDWGFVIFVVDSLKDDDGMFVDTPTFAYTEGSYFNGGHYTVMTYDNGQYYIDDMDAVTAHEMGHIFGAQDQYGCFDCSNPSGYLFVENQNCEISQCILSDDPSIMRANILYPFANELVDYYARGQIGWRDSDGDGVLDIIGKPTVSLQGYQLNPHFGEVVSYGGTGQVNVYYSPNPAYSDVSINTISNIQYRYINGITSAWFDADALDGLFNNFTENYTFSKLLPWGEYTFETRAVNDMNIESNYTNDTLALIGCSDTDSDLDRYIVGNVNNYNGTTQGNETDECLSPTKLRQYLCSGYDISYQEINCKYGCNLGVCNEAPSTDTRFRREL